MFSLEIRILLKGYGYVYGIVESIQFVLNISDNRIIYNYAERDCVSLRKMVQTIQVFLGIKAITFRIPMSLLVFISYLLLLISVITRKRFAIHPVRLRKLTFPTNLKPQYLLDKGFYFKYPLEKALIHWRSVAPEDL